MTANSGDKKGYGLSSKGNKAYSNICAIKSDVDNMKRILKGIADAINEISIPEVTTVSGVNGKPCNDLHRSAIIHDARRIVFEVAGLQLYVEFTLAVSKDGSGQEVEGIVVYGTSRTLCFTTCHNPKKENTSPCER